MDKTPECFMCGVRGSEPMDAVQYHMTRPIKKYRCTDRIACGDRSHQALAKALIIGPGPVKL